VLSESKGSPHCAYLVPLEAPTETIRIVRRLWAATSPAGSVQQRRHPRREDRPEDLDDERRPFAVGE
jgi:hypothetical protein